MRGIRPPLPALLSLFWEKVQRHNQEQVGIGFLGFCVPWVLVTLKYGKTLFQVFLLLAMRISHHDSVDPLAKPSGCQSVTEQSAAFSAAAHGSGVSELCSDPSPSNLSWLFKVMRWRGRSRRSTCAMRSYLGEQCGGETLTSWWGAWTISPGLWHWLCVSPGEWPLPAEPQQLLPGFAVSAQFVLSEIKHRIYGSDARIGW